MNCWHCDRTAHGTCHFCGRGLCKAHVRTMPAVIAVYRNREEHLKAVVTNDVLYCGVCTPEGHPIPLDELDE